MLVNTDQKILGQSALVVVTPTKSNKTTAAGSLANICNEEPTIQHNVGASSVAGTPHGNVNKTLTTVDKKMADVDMFSNEDDEYFLNISDGIDKSNNSITPPSANSMGNDTDHKHPSSNDDECKGGKAINNNDVVNLDVNVDKNAHTDSPKGTEASSDIGMICSRTESNEISDGVTFEEAEQTVNSLDESTICGSNKDVSPDIRENNKLHLSELSCSIPVTDDANTCVKEHSHDKYGNTKNVKKEVVSDDSLPFSVLCRNLFKKRISVCKNLFLLHYTYTCYYMGLTL